MSYILEALKKAQAERQLGNAPTIHAQQAVPVAPARAAGGRKPLLVGLGAAALVIAAGALFVWRQAPTAAPPARLDAARTPAPAPASMRAPDALQVSAPPAPAPARVAEPPMTPAAQAAAASVAQTPAPRPGPAAPAVAAPAVPAQAVIAPAPAPARVNEAAAARPAPAAPAQVAAAPARATEPAAARPAPPAQAAAKPAPEDSLPFLQQLPDAQQRDIPRVTFGGYMYSANPADRLLLVDKTLRHEGEEVAPGLVLEKLLPKAAVMNYRGLRYRVVY
jgi:general secretion pathway protein B